MLFHGNDQLTQNFVPMGSDESKKEISLKNNNIKLMAVFTRDNLPLMPDEYKGYFTVEYGQKTLDFSVKQRVQTDVQYPSRQCTASDLDWGVTVD